MEFACVTEHGFAVLENLTARTVSLSYYNIWVPALCLIKGNSVQTQNKGLWEIYKRDHIFPLLSNLLGGEEGKRSTFLWDDAFHPSFHPYSLWNSSSFPGAAQKHTVIHLCSSAVWEENEPCWCQHPIKQHILRAQHCTFTSLPSWAFRREWTQNKYHQ